MCFVRIVTFGFLKLLGHLVDVVVVFKYFIIYDRIKKKYKKHIKSTYNQHLNSFVQFDLTRLKFIKPSN